MADSLVDLVVRGIRDRIQSGAYRRSAVLPARGVLAAEFGVSEMTVRKALARLRAARELVSRRGLGHLVVRCPEMPSRLVLDVRTESTCTFAGMSFTHGLRKGMRAFGGECRTVELDDSCSRADIDNLKLALQANPGCVVFRSGKSDFRRFLRVIADSGCPYVNVTVEPPRMKRCLGTVSYDATGAVSDFVGDCVRAGVTSVLQANFGEGSCVEAGAELEKAGIGFERMVVDANCGSRGLDRIVESAFCAMSRRIDAGPLPDLLLLADDFIAGGAMNALNARGIRIPADVRVVAYVNRGSGFAFNHSLSCFEFDPYAEGELVADGIRRYFATGVFPQPLVCGPDYCRGSSFPLFR